MNATVEDGTIVFHSSYPHFPGMLYDCPGCEDNCYCDPSAEYTCIHCDGERGDLEADCYA